MLPNHTFIENLENIQPFESLTSVMLCECILNDQNLATESKKYLIIFFKQKVDMLHENSLDLGILHSMNVSGYPHNSEKGNIWRSETWGF